MRHTKHNNKYQKGGMLLESLSSANAEINFSNFINDSNPTILAQGAYGFVIKWQLNAGSTNDKYKKIIPTAEFGNKITTIIIKLCCIRPMDKFNPDEVDVGNIRSVSETEFINETNIQTDIYLKTINYLQPICPGIAYANIVPVELTPGQNIINPDTIFGKIVTRCASSFNLKNIINRIISFINKNSESTIIPKYKIGVIAMEMAENLTSNNVSTNYDFANIGRYALLNLALTTGYTHGDFHKGNILICDSTSYFNGVNYRPIIIDFGRTVKLPPDKFDQLKAFVSNHDYISALKILCYSNQYVSDIEYDKHFYGWVCGDYDLDNRAYEKAIDKYKREQNFGKPTNAQISSATAKLKVPKPSALPETINAEIDMLFQAREIAIDANIATMNLAHEQDPIKYPLLPMSNQIKNKLFSGLIGGKKRKRMRREKRQKKTRKNRRSKT